MGGNWSKFSMYDLPFSRYALYPDRLVLRVFWSITTIDLKQIEKVSFWYSLHGAKAQVFSRMSDSTVILTTNSPVELGQAFERFGVDIEVAKSIV
jgi:hypothetical protein